MLRSSIKLGRKHVSGLKLVSGLKARLWTSNQPTDVLLGLCGSFTPRINPLKTCGPSSQGTSLDSVWHTWMPEVVSHYFRNGGHFLIGRYFQKEKVQRRAFDIFFLRWIVLQINTQKDISWWLFLFILLHVPDKPQNKLGLSWAKFSQAGVKTGVRINRLL